MRSSPNPYCACGCLMVEAYRHGPFVCVWCDLGPAVTVLPPINRPRREHRHGT